MTIRTSFSIALIAFGWQVVNTKTCNAGEKPIVDPVFVTRAADGWAAKVQAGKIAEVRATNADVKRFAAQMVVDYTNAYLELTSFATKLKLELPAKISEKHQEMLDILNDSKLQNFDREYMRLMVEGHERMAEVVRRATYDISDHKMRIFAEKMVPIANQRLQIAKTVYGQLVKDEK